jgi:hypothetical protein
MIDVILRIGTFWAYLGSSAVVEARSELWQYWIPAQQHMPTNCSNDVQLVVQHMDHVLAAGK